MPAALSALSVLKDKLPNWFCALGCKDGSANAMPNEGDVAIPFGSPMRADWSPQW